MSNIAPRRVIRLDGTDQPGAVAIAISHLLYESRNKPLPRSLQSNIVEIWVRSFGDTGGGFLVVEPLRSRTTSSWESYMDYTYESRTNDSLQSDINLLPKNSGTNVVVLPYKHSPVPEEQFIFRYRMTAERTNDTENILGCFWQSFLPRSLDDHDTEMKLCDCNISILQHDTYRFRQRNGQEVIERVFRIGTSSGTSSQVKVLLCSLFHGKIYNADKTAIQTKAEKIQNFHWVPKVHFESPPLRHVIRAIDYNINDEKDICVAAYCPDGPGTLARIVQAFIDKGYICDRSCCRAAGGEGCILLGLRRNDGQTVVRDVIERDLESVFGTVIELTENTTQVKKHHRLQTIDGKPWGVKGSDHGMSPIALKLELEQDNVGVIYDLIRDIVPPGLGPANLFCADAYQSTIKQGKLALRAGLLVPDQILSTVIERLSTRMIRSDRNAWGDWIADLSEFGIIVERKRSRK